MNVGCEHPTSIQHTPFHRLSTGYMLDRCWMRASNIYPAGRPSDGCWIDVGCKHPTCIQHTLSDPLSTGSMLDKFWMRILTHVDIHWANPALGPLWALLWGLVGPALRPSWGQPQGPCGLSLGPLSASPLALVGLALGPCWASSEAPVDTLKLSE